MDKSLDFSPDGFDIEETLAKTDNCREHMNPFKVKRQDVPVGTSGVHGLTDTTKVFTEGQ